MKLKRWTPGIDPRTIPDEILKSERARRNSLKRQSYTGGVFWKEHNPATTRCRCENCMVTRATDRFQALHKSVSFEVTESGERFFWIDGARYNAAQYVALAAATEKTVAAGEHKS